MRLRPASRLRACPGRVAGRRSRRVRRLPESVGLQRADRVRAQPAVLLHEAGRCPCRRPRADAPDPRHPHEHATGTIGASIMDYDYNVEYSQTWSGGLQYQLWPATMVEVSYMGTWTLGADNATVRNVPEPGPGSIQSRRPIPQLSRSTRFDSTASRSTTASRSRLDRRLRAASPTRQLHALALEGRCVEPWRDGIRDQRAAERSQRLRRVSGEWALSSFDHRHQVIASGVVPAAALRRPRRISRRRSGWLACQRHPHGADPARRSR